MLRRIAEIKNVGTFSNCVAREVQLEKITLIYGRNTYGKSTLGDIFYSLEKNSADLITSRKSIPEPEQNSSQSIEMQFAAEGENERDGIARFRGGVWQQGLRASHNLKIFNDAFYHNYVFAARKFTRETRVNLSQFILGEHGVALANQINEQNAAKAQATRRKNTLTRDVFSTINNIEDFLQLPVLSNIQDLQLKKSALVVAKHDLLKQQQGLDELRNRHELSHINIDTQSLLTGIKEINELLVTSLDSHHEEAKAKLQQHIEHHFSSTLGSEHWIQQGLKYGKDNNCQFCGQTLNNDAQSLIESYKQYFNEEYDRHEAYISQELDRLTPAFNPNLLQQALRIIEGNLLSWDLYTDLPCYLEARDQLRGMSLSLQTLIADFEQIINQLNKDLIERTEYKKQWPHKPLEPISDISLAAAIETLNNLFEAYAGLIEHIGIAIDQFKEHLTDDHIQNKLTDLENQISEINWQLERINKTEACSELINLNSLIEQLNNQIPMLEAQLNEDQSTYLDNYFQNINEYFLKLGSSNFELSRELDRSGHTPVYSLKVKFHGIAIAENELDKVFSESDRRALGLSVFMASLDAIGKQELKKTVVVFDDPVTSFDDHRVGTTHRELVSLADRCEQVILLSHYREGLSQFIKTYTFGREHKVKLVEIERDHQSSRFKAGNFDEFIRFAHEENREKIIDFIERRTESLPCPLRPYLEQELSLRFGKQIREQSITNDNLNNRIEDLVAKGVIAAAIGDQLHRWRTDLNPEHHVWLGNDIEDKRSTARSFFQFVYHTLVPAV